MVSRHNPRRVTLAYVRSTEAMGQQEYESQLIAALTKQRQIDIRVLAMRAFRSRGQTGRRISLDAAARLPAWAQPVLAAGWYRRTDLVHRLDTRLPARPNDVLTIHDLAPLMFDDEGQWPRHATIGARRAAVVVVPSRASERDVRSKLEVQRVHVIPYGVDPACWRSGALTRGDRQALGGPLERYLVYAGGSSRRKNLGALAAAWLRISADHPGVELLICGPDSEAKRRLFGHLPACRLLGRIDRSLLLNLMASSIAVVVPSTYEGFGLPVLEAMAAGTIVVASKASALPEIAGDAALLVEPTAEGLAAGVVAAISSQRERRVESGRVWAAQFSWAETARRHVELYSALSLTGMVP